MEQFITRIQNLVYLAQEEKEELIAAIRSNAPYIERHRDYYESVIKGLERINETTKAKLLNLNKRSKIS